MFVRLDKEGGFIGSDALAKQKQKARSVNLGLEIDALQQPATALKSSIWTAL